MRVSNDACGSDLEVRDSSTLFVDSGLWTVARAGRPATVTMRLETSDGKLVDDPNAVIGVGLYTPGPPTTKDPMPNRTPPTSPDDYVEDGFRYRAKIGGATLVKAMIAEEGRNTLTFEFTPSSDRLRIAPFCLGGDPQWVKVSINDAQQSASESCGIPSRDLGGNGYSAGEPGAGWPGIKVGKPNTVTVSLTDKTGRLLSGNARIGAGVYLEGEQRVVASGMELDEVIEHGGFDYRLASFRTADATTATSLSIPTPAGMPFVVFYRVTATDATGSLYLDGLDESPGMNLEFGGFSTTGQPARGTGNATVRLEGKPKRGTMVVAVYELVR